MLQLLQTILLELTELLEFDNGVVLVPNCYWQCGKKAFLWLESFSSFSQD